MTGWFRCEAKAWPLIVASFGGTEWPAEVCAMDLRWHEDQQLPIPGRPTLRARWGRTDWFVRSMLRDEARWKDPHKAPPAHRQPTASAPPADRQRTASQTTDETGQSDENRQPTASAPPADRQPTASAPPHARSTTPSPSPSQAPETEVDPVGSMCPPPAFQEAWDRYADSSGAPRHDWSKGRLRKALDRESKRHGWPALLTMLRWLTEAQDPDVNGGASFHRSRQSDGLTIIGRAGPLEARIDRARTWAEKRQRRPAPVTETREDLRRHERAPAPLPAWKLAQQEEGR